MQANNKLEHIAIHDLERVAAFLLDAWPQARIFAFYGEMGAGKTTFIKALCRHMGVIDPVSSPTFAIVNVYQTIQGEQVNHFDCYRMKSMEEFYDIGYEDYFFSGEHCLIEWPEKIEPLLPDDSVAVSIFVDKESGLRTFTF